MPEHDIAYLDPDRAEKLDAWLPPDSIPGPRPAVLLIHGGGWYSGDKAAARERNIGATLSAHGYAVFSINYLLNEAVEEPDGTVRHTRIAWPRNLHDCEAALEWVRTEAPTRYDVDPDRVAVMGGSAGGTFSLLLAAAHPDRIRAVVSLYAPIDMRGSRTSKFASAQLAEEAEARAVAASPICHLRPGLPPVFVAHGTADAVVPVAESRRLVEALKSHGIVHEYVEVPGAPHSFHLQPEQVDLRPAVLRFLARHLAGGGRGARKESVPGGNRTHI